MLFAHVLSGIVNFMDLDNAAPVAVAIDQTPYQWLKTAIKLAIIAGYTSVILVMLLGQSRVFYSMSRDGLLPRLFSDIHPKFRTPWRSNLLFMLFVGLFAAFAPIQFVGHMTSIGTLFTRPPSTRMRPFSSTGSKTPGTDMLARMVWRR